MSTFVESTTVVGGGQWEPLAVRAVASMAVDADDCANLLAILGLEATEGKP